MSCWLARDRRITKNSGYRRVYDTGTKTVGRFLILFYLGCAAGSGGPRVGITVSSKVGGACVRNKVKRRIKESLNLLMKEWSGLEACKEGPEVQVGVVGQIPDEMVFVALKRITEASFKDIRADISGLIKRAQK